MNSLISSLETEVMLQEHPLLAWPLFIFFLTLLVPILLYSEPPTLLSVHDIITPYPYHTLGRWLSPCHLYHSLGLWLSPPFTLTLLPVSDSVPFLPAYLCTTTYSLVCAQVPYVYKPCVPQLYSLTWIYLVLHGYLVPNLYLWSSTSLWPLVIVS